MKELFEMRLDKFLEYCRGFGLIIEVINNKSIDIEPFYEEKDYEKLKKDVLKNDLLDIIINEDEVYLVYTDRRMVILSI